jgi:hypothetical protein
MWKHARTAWRATLVTLYITCAWVAGFAVIAWWIADAVLTYLRERRARAATIRCSRGHAVSQWGAFRCPCGSVYEGSCWSCPTCGEGGLIECPTCGLTIRNPRLV